jgi:hypothetical protein
MKGGKKESATASFFPRDELHLSAKEQVLYSRKGIKSTRISTKTKDISDHYSCTKVTCITCLRFWMTNLFLFLY